ncbi:sensor histidine kinase [Leptolyngbya sp. 7M]|uniref:sensor histidine kinase n=1 Tax=Leptolyngbya sp. 7M TaxID=2812896 RepID=UPI001B8BFD96|nr:HAMP domain-containing sensor histidine kinase [Leptolyngbya sp. 7M]QYO65961.1 HAMP domain-containing protein [Leptolyngbya sp. 7M]
MNFFNTFRGRLLIVFAWLLVATLGVQFYLNLRTQRENIERRERQEQALVAAFAVGVSGITSRDEYLEDLIAKPGQTFLDESARERIRDIIIINERWQVADSLDPDHFPRSDAEGNVVFKPLSEVSGLPPLMESGKLGEDLARFPNRPLSERSEYDDEAHAIPIETSDGRYYVMVILKNDKREAAWRAAEPLLYTLCIFLVSTAITFILVWRFTRPITDLAAGAKRIAEGDLAFRVPNQSNDEMGMLTQRFNEMASELEKSRELQEQLRQAEKSAVIGRLGSAIAHEIRNPLNYINLTLDHLRSKLAPEDPEKQDVFRKLVSQIKDEVARINQQISDFLNYSRPANVNLRPVAAREVIADSLRIIEGQAEENGITIGIIEHEDVPQILGDPEYLRSVFNNLFINALQAMGAEGGNLTVKITRDDHDDMVSFEIADTGSGIAEENLTKIFEPYFSTKETGTGLGLAIVQKIVEVHNGSIEVSSVVGEGTRFTVKLPSAKH